MQIDVILCDHGQVSGDKLFISGGGIDRMFVGPGSGPYIVNFGAAGTVTVPPTEAVGDHVVGLRLEMANGHPAALHGEAEGAVIGGELHLGGSPEVAAADQTVAFAFNFNTIPLAATGNYVLVCTLDGTEVRWLSFKVEQAS